ncbi:uncharacterized protein ALTATR162_LOCUS5079 [Alternaria atra]|uniref:F-box domain-containing protein n=1 Tax=Alternaria atra TaxID=119953 RepID=A0A8J2I1N3_9PLEO|nr:uncharacterized protein ALTATR162_LOCUS5079 [Alternaria atra]CAG5158437.1 unnamed protein product [Alternaria atra]
MNQLPQELVDRISSYLSRDDLKNTLLLSHAFRFPAEKYSGAFTSFDLKEKTTDKFIDTFSSHRLQYLRDVKFEIILPSQDEEDRDNAEQLSKHDQSFTQQIMFLFKTVKTVEERAGPNNGPGTVRLEIGSPRRKISWGTSLSIHHHLSWRVHLLEPDALPSLESVRSLGVGGEWYRESSGQDFNWGHVKMDYRVMVDLVVKLPNLDYWGCQIGGDEWSPKTEQEAAKYFTQDWAGPRRDTRQDFAKALMAARLPESLRRVRLDFLFSMHDITNIDHLTAQPDMVSPAGSDLFSTGLNHLSHHLRRLHLRVVADETLFMPKDNCTSSWPNLESFVVMFHMVSPSGQWYFVGPNGEGRNTAATKVTDASYPPLKTTDYDRDMDHIITFEGDRRSEGIVQNFHVRVVPNETTLRPFLAAFAKAASNMRALQEAVLWCPLSWEPGVDEDGEENIPMPDCVNVGYEPSSLAWGVNYVAPGEPRYNEEPDNFSVQVPHLWWKVGTWRPDAELHELFRQIGRVPWGDGLQERWDDVLNGERYVDREHFEECVQEKVDRSYRWERQQS